MDKGKLARMRVKASYAAAKAASADWKWEDWWEMYITGLPEANTPEIKEITKRMFVSTPPSKNLV